MLNMRFYTVRNASFADACMPQLSRARAPDRCLNGIDAHTIEFFNCISLDSCQNRA
jgi:hypothetical protein